jgi:hypothetical protein
LSSPHEMWCSSRLVTNGDENAKQKVCGPVLL